MALNTYCFNFLHMQPMPSFGYLTMPSLCPPVSLFGCNTVYNKPFFSPFPGFNMYGGFSPFINFNMPLMSFNTSFVPSPTFNPFINFGLQPLFNSIFEESIDEVEEIRVPSVENNSPKQTIDLTSQPISSPMIASKTISTISTSQIITPPVIESFSPKTKKAKKQVKTTPERTSYTPTRTTSLDSNYAYMNKVEAEAAAKKDSNLEKLTGGLGWSVSSASFINDIPYAKKGMSEFLTKLSREIGENIVVTSALGTASSPHAKSGGHYDSNNPKLDFGGGLSHSKAYSLKRKLDSTGYFSRVEVEINGNTAHLDVKVKESALNGLQTTA